MVIKTHDGIEYQYKFERLVQDAVPIEKWEVQFEVSRVEDGTPVWIHSETGLGLFNIPLSEIYSILGE